MQASRGTWLTIGKNMTRIRNTKPAYYPETGEYWFNDRWYDANDPDDMSHLSLEIKAAEEYEIDAADYHYHMRKDEGRW